MYFPFMNYNICDIEEKKGLSLEKLTKQLTHMMEHIREPKVKYISGPWRTQW